MTFKIGDKVKIVRSAKGFENDGLGFDPMMDDYIGKEFTVSEVDEHGYGSLEFGWWWPIECLEAVIGTYSVQQVLQATDDMYDTGMMIHAQEIEKYLENRQDPEWKEYQRLKEKFEG